MGDNGGEGEFRGRLRRPIFERMEPRCLLSAPALDGGVLLKSGTSPLVVDGPNAYSAPCVGDWNADGKKDLLVGQFNNGNIWLFLNQGTDARPSFGKGTLLKSGGSPITTSYG